ncbi:MAG: phage portal protein [Clostridia bacterium]|nr:phage portal protein [Clostridia bacterium]
MKTNKDDKGKKSNALSYAITRPKDFSSLSKSISGTECILYDALKENVPIINAAIHKIIRLIGGFRVECDNKYSQKPLEDFLKTVPVGSAGVGIASFLSQYADSLLTYGTAVGEIVVGDRTKVVKGLYNADIKELKITEKKGGMGVDIAIRSSNTPVKKPELISVSALNPTPKNPMGNSLLSGLDFVSEILLKIYDCIGTNFERLGNLRFAVTYNPPDNLLDGGFAGDRAAEIAREWSAAMSDSSSVKDFVAVGDVKIKVIGSDNQMIDTNIPVRQMLEQIIAKLGIPPFLLGLTWSTTERMSSEQVDILTSELWYYRSILEPVIMKICNEFLLREGLQKGVTVVWDNISLKDEVELAKARLFNAQAKALESNTKGEEN